MGKGCAVTGKASVQSGPLQTSKVGTKQCRCQRLSRAVALDIGHPCGEHTRTSATRVENTPGHRPPVRRTHQDIAHPCGEHTRISPTRVENTPGHRPPEWRTHQDIAYSCGEHTRTSPTRVENTPGHRPPVWRIHQDIAHPCGEHTSTSPIRVENTPRVSARVTTGSLSMCQLRCLFMAHAFVWLSCSVKSFDFTSSCQLKQNYVVKKHTKKQQRARISCRSGVCCWVLE